MLLIENDVANSILESSENLVNKVLTKDSKIEVRKIVHNAPPGKKLSNEERTLIGTVARAGLGTDSEIAEQFGISRQHTNNLKHGRVDSSIDHPELREGIKEKLIPIQDKAINILMESLGLLTVDKMKDCNAKDISTISANVSKIIDNTREKEVSIDNRTQIVMYSPGQKKLSDYKVVEI